VNGAPPLGAHAEALRGRSLPPRDPGVPQLRDLLRPHVMTAALERAPGEVGALAQWYPLDLAMPAPARPSGEPLRAAAAEEALGR
jgi:hypothetical protein